MAFSYDQYTYEQLDFETDMAYAGDDVLCVCGVYEYVFSCAILVIHI